MTPKSAVDHAWAARATLVWAVLTSLVATVLVLPFVLMGPWILVQSLVMPVSVKEAAGCLTLSFLGGLFLYVVLRCTVLSALAVRRSPGYPDRHWVFVQRAFRSLRWTALGLLVTGSGLAAYAVFGRERFAVVAPAVAFVALIWLWVYLSTVVGMNDALRHATVLPYFPSKVGGIETFAEGESLARHVADCDRLAGSLGLTPLSSFGWNDDMEGEPLVWHRAAEGLKTVNALLSAFEGDDIAWADHAGTVGDLKRLAHALARADAQGTPFSLLLRHSTVTSAVEWEVRKGTCF